MAMVNYCNPFLWGTIINFQIFIDIGVCVCLYMCRVVAAKDISLFTCQTRRIYIYIYGEYWTCLGIYISVYVWWHFRIVYNEIYWILWFYFGKNEENAIAKLLYFWGTMLHSRIFVYMTNEILPASNIFGLKSEMWWSGYILGIKIKYGYILLYDI